MTDPTAPFAGLDESALQKLAPGGAQRSARSALHVLRAAPQGGWAPPRVWLLRFFARQPARVIPVCE
ncbi:MAG: hypothetical protein EPO20_22245 [Betaproteobacteria bacterium]|nr:MAG: hypothetical protein EPO20_22245 [Betaproteobacteria bacterium]